MNPMENADYARAYNFIRERILRREYAPGFSLKPDVLAKEIGLSRTPVRDALRQLDADGLVSIRPRIGASVRSTNADEFREICELRMALEIHAAGLAARMHTEGDLRDMALAHEAVARELERLIAACNPLSFRVEDLTSELLVREDIHFHMAVTSAAKNRLIRREILRQHLINHVVTASAVLLPEPYLPVSRPEQVVLARATVAEHHEIYEAIRSGNSGAAKEAMEKHLQQSLDSMLRRIARGESGRLVEDMTGPAPGFSAASPGMVS